MKIYELLSGVRTAVTNEEQQFIQNHQSHVKLGSLNERDSWIAQSLVRKGIFTISKDSNTLMVNFDDIST
jgi:hypothetical protein